MKTAYDPDNVFNSEQSVPVSPAGPRSSTATWFPRRACRAPEGGGRGGSQPRAPAVTVSGYRRRSGAAGVLGDSLSARTATRA
ncbi:BBE domain-containing protein [Rhodococcus oxybenzonivorans]|uniref:BBE domain-containing protein n=1 Tax=Rhodococcus oxybenzonivorans TaxID=1990687 RepID=UPI001E3EBAB9|nr:BBE domain-containing protein [Rhodococcus oxybenzonivorans]